MEPQRIEIEGTWDEIAAQVSHMAGRRFRLIVLPEDPESSCEREDTRSLEEKLAAISAQVPDEEWAKLPPDMAENLDHYIYGTPKGR
jgi:hypothetical protein